MPFHFPEKLIRYLAGFFSEEERKNNSGLLYQVDQYIGDLLPGQQAILNHLYVDGWSIKKVAAHTGRSSSYVSHQRNIVVFRLLKDLDKTYQQQLQQRRSQAVAAVRALHPARM